MRPDGRRPFHFLYLSLDLHIVFGGRDEDTATPNNGTFLGHICHWINPFSSCSCPLFYLLQAEWFWYTICKYSHFISLIEINQLWVVATHCSIKMNYSQGIHCSGSGSFCLSQQFSARIINRYICQYESYRHIYIRRYTFLYSGRITFF